MIENDLFTRAIAFAAVAHEGQVRKGSDTPYIVHPLEAAAVCATLSSDPEVLSAAVLHDVVEDTPATIDDIRREFGERVANLVAGESEDKREHMPAEQSWQLRKEETIAHVASATDPAVRIVCMGDKLSNIRSMQRDFAEQGSALWDRFNQKDPAKHAWYYARIGQVLQPELGHSLAWQEYDRIMREVFGSYLA